MQWDFKWLTETSYQETITSRETNHNKSPSSQGGVAQLLAEDPTKRTNTLYNLMRTLNSSRFS